ncbi:MAG: sulfurtransferase TusA family protein [Deltaproteobacteria bacterium]|nr:sulfurtransferase TusA family protein [Deltaproteobacteria bacterium]
MNFYEIPPSYDAEIDELERLIQSYRQGALEATKFRAHRVPFGVYEQRAADTYMVRIRCAGGGVTPRQLKAVALLSEQYGADTIHITTRQELQIHDVILENVPAILRELRKADLATRGGGGNTVRNIMASWDAGIAPGEPFDVTPYAVSLTSMLIAKPDSWTLPRKYKIAFSNSDEDNAHAVFNDLGFIAAKAGTEEGFRVYVAGGMGTKPQTGHVLHEFIPAAQAYRVAEAVKKVFDRHGNRKNKHAARLRFLWNKLGEAKFRELYEEEYRALEGAPLPAIGEIRNEAASRPGLAAGEPASGFSLWKERFVSSQKQAGLFSILAPVTLGNISCRHAVALAETLETFGENVLRCTLEQNLSIRNIPEAYLGHIYSVLKDASDLSSAPKFYGNCIACTGAGTCKLGICLPRGALTAVNRKLMSSKLDMDAVGRLRLNISGCPNTCGAHMTADLGFFGQVERKGQRMYPSYAVVAGARVGSDAPRLAARIGDVSARDLPDFVAGFFRLYIRKKDQYPDFAAYMEKEGTKDIKRLCAKYVDIPGFEEDKNYYFDWGAEEIFSLVGRGVGECSAGLFDLIELDMKTIKKGQKELEKLSDPSASADVLYRIALAAARMLLITRGVEASSDREVFDNFVHYFVECGLVDRRFLPLLELAKNENRAQLATMKEDIFALTRTVEDLYESMDDSLKFPAEKKAAETPSPGEKSKPAAAATGTAQEQTFKDLRGVACPMNFVKTKMELSAMQPGQRLRIFLDDGEPIVNVPRSVAEEGHRVMEQTKTGDYWSVLIERH